MEIYVDTNLFLECRPLETQPWEDLLEGDDDLVLVLTDPVVSEIDEKKSAGASRLRKAARRALSLIDAVEDADEVAIREAAPRVVLRYDAGRPLRDDRLEEARNDHRLVGIAAARAVGAEVPVAVLSGDRGVRLKAKALGLARLGIPEGWRRADTPTDDEARIRELEEETTRLRSKEPAISLRVDDPSSPPARFEMPQYPPLTGDEVNALVEDLRSRYPIETVFDRKRNDLLQQNLGLVSVRTFVHPSDEKISNYRNSYERWLEGQSHEFEDFHDRPDLLHPVFTLLVSLTNTGTRPAEALTIDFVARGPLAFSDGLHMGVVPRDLRAPPAAPQGKWTDLFGTGAAMDRIFDTAPLVPFPRREEPPREDDRFYVRDLPGLDATVGYGFTCALFRHGSEAETFPIEVVSDRRPKIGETVSGAVEVAVTASNLSDPVRLTVPVEILGVEGDTMAEARRAIEAIEAED